MIMHVGGFAKQVVDNYGWEKTVPHITQPKPVQLQP